MGIFVTSFFASLGAQLLPNKQKQNLPHPAKEAKSQQTVITLETADKAQNLNVKPFKQQKHTALSPIFRNSVKLCHRPGLGHSKSVQPQPQVPNLA